MPRTLCATPTATRSKTIQSLTRKGKIGDAFVQAENAVIFFGSEGLGLAGLDGAGKRLRPGAARDRPHRQAEQRADRRVGVRQPPGRGRDRIRAGGQPAGGVRSGVGGLHRGRRSDRRWRDQAPRAGRRRPFMLVQDLFETETARAADVVLPAQTYMEREGTFTSRRAARPALPCGRSRRWRAPSRILPSRPRWPGQSGVILEGSSASVVFDIMAAEEDFPVRPAELCTACRSARAVADRGPRRPVLRRHDLREHTGAGRAALQRAAAGREGEPAARPQGGHAAAARRSGCWACR